MSAHRSDARVSTPLDRVAGAATPALILPTALGAGLIVIAGVSGKLGYLLEHLPLTERPNGFTLLWLLALAVFCWRQIRRYDRLEAADWIDTDWPGVDLDDCWYGTEAEPERRGDNTRGMTS
jgi:hypothetical protein